MPQLPLPHALRRQHSARKGLRSALPLKIWLALGLLAAIAGLSGAREAQSQPVGNEALLSRVAIQVLLRDRVDQDHFVGSGVLLSRRVAVTARHVLLESGRFDGAVDERAAQNRVYISLGDNQNPIQISGVTCIGGDGSIGARTPDVRDICLLTIRNPEASNLLAIADFPKPSCDWTEGGSFDLRAFGWYPRGGEIRRFPIQRYQFEATRDNADSLDATLQLLPGTSGGGVYDTSGRLLGLVSAGIGPAHNLLMIALVDVARDEFIRRGIQCHSARSGQEEPTVTLQFAARVFRHVPDARRAHSGEQNPQPLHAEGLRLSLSVEPLEQGAVQWTADHVELDSETAGRFTARAFGPPLPPGFGLENGGLARLSLEHAAEGEAAALRRLVPNPVSVRMTRPGRAGEPLRLVSRIDVYEQLRFVENRRSAAALFERAAYSMIAERPELRCLNSTVPRGQSPEPNVLRNLARCRDQMRSDELASALDGFLSRAAEVRDRAIEVARDVDPYLAQAIRLNQLRFQVGLGQICEAREASLPLLDDMVSMTNGEPDPYTGVARGADTQERPTRRETFLVAVRYTLVCRDSANNSQAIDRARDLLDRMGRLEDPAALDPYRRRILQETFPIVSQFAPARAAVRFMQLAQADEHLLGLWDAWVALVDRWCGATIERSTIVAEWGFIQQTLDNRRSCPALSHRP